MFAQWQTENIALLNNISRQLAALCRPHPFFPFLFLFHSGTRSLGTLPLKQADLNRTKRNLFTTNALHLRSPAQIGLCPRSNSAFVFLVTFENVCVFCLNVYLCTHEHCTQQPEEGTRSSGTSYNWLGAGSQTLVLWKSRVPWRSSQCS